MGGSRGELQDLSNRLVDRATVYGMEVSEEKSKVMTNSTDNICADVTGFLETCALECRRMRS